MDSRIKQLLGKNIYVGTSSWKYPGWAGWFYRRPYASQKAFNEDCLEEYAEHYPAVGVDHTYYAWPLQKTFERYLHQTPSFFRFALKVTDRVTVFRFPKQPRYGKEAGKDNPGFLDPNLFKKEFLKPLEPFAGKLAPLMFEFSQFYPGMLPTGREFIERLDHFFSSIQDDRFQYSVEIRNHNWLKEAFYRCLERHGVAPVFNSWTRMPPLAEQARLATPYRFPCLVARILLAPGTAYEEAVEAFSPYDQVLEPSATLRASIADWIEQALELKLPAYLFVNNRSEGCAPRTIEAVLDILRDRGKVGEDIATK